MNTTTQSRIPILIAVLLLAATLLGVGWMRTSAQKSESSYSSATKVEKVEVVETTNLGSNHAKSASMVAASAGSRMMATSGFPSGNIVRTEVVAMNALPMGEFQEAEMHEGDCIFFDEEFEMMEAFGYETTIAETIGITEDELFTGWEAGKTTAEIARDNGIDPQVVVDALVAEETAFIDELVAEGEISEEEAQEWRDESAKWVAFDINHAHTDPFVVAAKTIGLDEDAFWTEFESGKSAADIAKENGVDAQIVIDALVASQNAEIDAMVEANVLSSEEADEWRTYLVEEMTALVNDDMGMFFHEEEMYGYEIAEGEYEDGVYVDEIYFEDDELPEDCFFGDEMFFFEETIANTIGITVDQLFEGWEAGKSTTEIAQDNNVDPQVVIDALVAEETAFIDELVAEGETSEEEAQVWRDETAKWTAFDVNHVFVDPFTVAAKTIGLDEETFWTQLDGGKSVADLAKENGIDAQTVIDALVASQNAEIDAMLAADVISQEDADEWRADLIEEMTELVNEPFDFFYEDIEWEELDEDEYETYKGEA